MLSILPPFSCKIPSVAYLAQIIVIFKVPPCERETSQIEKTQNETRKFRKDFLSGCICLGDSNFIWQALNCQNKHVPLIQTGSRLFGEVVCLSLLIGEFFRAVRFFTLFTKKLLFDIFSGFLERNAFLKSSGL